MCIRDRAHGQALHKERQGDHVVGSTHILHDLDLAAAGKNAQADGAAHRDDADDHQHQHCLIYTSLKKQADHGYMMDVENRRLKEELSTAKKEAVRWSLSLIHI